MTQLVTPTLTLQELVAWVDAQLSHTAEPPAHQWAPPPEWADLKAAA